MDVAANAAHAQHTRSPRPPSAPHQPAPSIFFGLSNNGITEAVPCRGSQAALSHPTQHSQHRQAWAGTTHSPISSPKRSSPAAASNPLASASHQTRAHSPPPGSRSALAVISRDLQQQQQPGSGAELMLAKPAAPRAGTLPDMSDWEQWEKDEYFERSPSHTFPLARRNAAEGFPEWPCPNPLPPPRMARAKDVASVMSGYMDGGNDLRLMDQYLSLFTGRTAPNTADDSFDAIGALMAHSSEGERANLVSLGLDRPTLERQGVAPHHINRLYHLLHTNAVAFALTVAAEQRRLAALLTTKPGVPLQDRLLGFIMGNEADLEDELQPPGSPNKAKIKHGSSASSAHAGVGVGEGACEDEGIQMHSREADLKLAPLSNEELLKEPDRVVDMDEAITMAAAGNVVGMRRLLGRYRQLHKAVRARLEGRLKHEGERAQRLQDKLDAKDKELRENQQQLGTISTEVDSAGARIQELEEELAKEHEVVVAGQAINESLRDEIADIEAQWAAQQAETVARVTDQLQTLQQQSEGELDLREQYLQRLRELVTLQLRHDHEARKSKRLGDELSAVRVAGQAAASEAAALKVWRGRLEERAENAEGWALASKASNLDGWRAMAKEKAAHKVTLDRLYSVDSRVEHARSAAADMHARLSKMVKEQSALARDALSKSVVLQRQLDEAHDIQRIRNFELESARAAQTAAQQTAHRVTREQFNQQNKMIQLERSLKLAQDQASQDSTDALMLRNTNSEMEGELKSIRQKLRELVDFIEQKAITEAKLESNAKEIGTLKSDLAELQGAHASLEREASRLRVRESELFRLESLHAQLRQEHEALEGEHAGLKKEHDEALETLERQAIALEDAARKRKSDDAAVEEALQKVAMAEQSQKDAQKKTDTAQGRMQQIMADLDRLTVDKKALLEEVHELNKLYPVIADLKKEVHSLKERLRAAEGAQVQALSDQKWWMTARQQMQEGLQEFLAAGAVEAQQVMGMCASIQEGMTKLRGSMLGLLEGDVPQPGEPSPLAAVDAAHAQKVFGEVGELGNRLNALLHTQLSVHKDIMLRLQEAQESHSEELSNSQAFWQQTLEDARRHPEELSKVLISANVHAGANPEISLASLVPIYLLEVQAKEVSRLRATEGELRAASEAATARADAALSALSSERAADQTRQQHITVLVSMLRNQTRVMESELKSAYASRSLAEKAALAASKLVAESKYAVSKAKEREAVTGLVNIVPGHSVDRGVQTNHSEMWVCSPPTTLAEAGRRLTVSASVPTWGGDVGSGTVAEPPALHLLTSSTGRADRGLGRPATAAPVMSGSLSRSTGYLMKGEKPSAGMGGLEGWSRPSSGASTLRYGSRPSTAGPMAPSTPSGRASPARPSSSVFLHRPTSSSSNTRHTETKHQGFSPAETNHLNHVQPPPPTTSNHLQLTGQRDSHGSSPPLSVPSSPSASQQHPSFATASSLSSSPLTAAASASAAAPPAAPAAAAAAGESELSEHWQQSLTLSQDSAAFLDPWDWGTEVAPLVERVCELLSLQETLDVIADVYRSKAATDELHASQGAAPIPLPTFLGFYFDVVYSHSWGPRPLLPLAQFVASTRAHAGAYEVLAFGRAAHTLPARTPPSSPDRPASGGSTMLGTSRSASPPHTTRSPQRPLSAAVAAASSSSNSTSAMAQPPRTLQRPTTAPLHHSLHHSHTHSHSHPPSPHSPTQKSQSLRVPHRACSATTTHKRPASSLASSVITSQAHLRLSQPSQQQHPTQPHQQQQQQQQQLQQQQQQHLQLSRRQRCHQGPANALSLVPIQRPTSACSTLSPSASPSLLSSSAALLNSGRRSSLNNSHNSRAFGTSRSVDASRPSTAQGRSQQAQQARSPVQDTGAALLGSVLPIHNPLPQQLLRAALHTPDLECAMGALRAVGGAEDVVRYVAEGNPADYLSMEDLGSPVLEILAPELHALLQSTSLLLGVEIVPDLLLRPALADARPPPSPPVALLHLPHVSSASFATSSRAATRSAKKGPLLPRLKDGSFGWRRRAVLLMQPELLESFTQLQQQQQGLERKWQHYQEFVARQQQQHQYALLQQQQQQQEEGEQQQQQQQQEQQQQHAKQQQKQQQQQREGGKERAGSDLQDLGSEDSLSNLSGSGNLSYFAEAPSPHAHAQPPQQQQQHQQHHHQQQQEQQQQQQQPSYQHQQEQPAHFTLYPPRTSSPPVTTSAHNSTSGSAMIYSPLPEIPDFEEWCQSEEGQGLSSPDERALPPTPLYSPGEVQALLAMALAPVCLPGGSGWRLDLMQGAHASVDAGNAGVGRHGALAPADAITAAVLADLAPHTVQPHLPVQIRAKWASLYRRLSRVPLGCFTSGDRAALLTVGSLGCVATAIFKSCVGCSQPKECPEPPELLAEARSAYKQHRASGASSNSPIADVSHEQSQEPSPFDLRQLALLRIGALRHWAGSAECTQLAAARGIAGGGFEGAARLRL